MSAVMILKIFSDCCVWFAILVSGPISLHIPVLIPALICGISAGIAAFLQEKGRRLLRILSAAMPLCCLLLAQGAEEMLILAVPAIYTAVVILLGKLELEYYSYRLFFQKSLMLVGGVYLVENIWLFVIGAIRAELAIQMDPMVVLRYGLVHFLCGVMLQRQLRLGVGNREEGGRRQIAMLLGSAGAMTAGVMMAGPLLKFVMSVILVPFIFLGEVIAMLVSLLDKIGPEDKTYEEYVEGTGTPGLGAGTGLQQGVSDQTESNFDSTIIWVVLIVILLLIAAFVLLRSFHKRRVVGTPGETTRLAAKPKKKKHPIFSNRSRVRQIYRDFLRKEKELGMRLKSCDTSQDVLERIHSGTDQPSADRLRQVYLAARYDDRGNISRSQVEAAKRALKDTRRTKS